MVGLSIVLEGQKRSGGVGKNIPQVINKTTMVVINKPSSSSSCLPSPSNPSKSHKNLLFSPQTPFLAPTFLDQCFLCRQKLLPGKDIYMYKGDRGFCSVECRYRQIFMDEEESLRQEKQCSMAAMKPTSASSSSSSSSAASNQRKGTRNRGSGFAY
ncbi:uncharacterized protein LOC110750206 [Prunus avium]|uniref:Uncharacterized protein LOC110750206 n=1 Tax=Prunus avium TaxID=42229 RepID=A0A6P5RYF5_PRUAV|nr:uncharacterized protein LOC110750206 [Prunus avium]